MKSFVVNSIVILTLLVFLQLHEETNAEALANHHRKKNRHGDDNNWKNRKHIHSDEDNSEGDEHKHNNNNGNQPSLPPSSPPPSKGPPPVEDPPMETQIPRPQIFPPYGLTSQSGLPSGNQQISDNIGMYGNGNSVQQIWDHDTNIVFPITIQQNVQAT